MILTALPALPGQTKSSIQQNIAQILQLHEDLLAELQQAVPRADLTKVAQTETYPVTKAKHIRFHSADIMPGRLGEHKATRRLGHFKPSLHFPKYLYMPATKAGDLEISRVACHCLSYRYVATAANVDCKHCCCRKPGHFH